MPRMVLDHILVLPDTPPESESKLHLLDETREQQLKETLQGTVIEAGPGRWLENGQRAEMGVKKGDRIYFDFQSGIFVWIDNGKGREGKGQLHRVMREPDVLVIVDTPKRIVAS